MRTSANRQTVSTTARWNMAQSDAASPGAQKRPMKNQQTGKGSNLDQLQRALATATLHREQTTDPRLIQNLDHGILLLKAQIARITGVDYTGIDVNTVPDSITGYEFAGFPDGDDSNSTAINKPAVEQSPISSFAQFQLFGTLRQKITKVSPPSNATPAGFPVHPGIDPRSRSNQLRNVDNPEGSAFQYASDSSKLQVEQDTRDKDYKGSWYRQDDPSLHIRVHTGRGIVTSASPVRGKHGQHRGGYHYIPEIPQGG